MKDYAKANGISLDAVKIEFNADITSGGPAFQYLLKFDPNAIKAISADNMSGLLGVIGISPESRSGIVSAWKKGFPAPDPSNTSQWAVSSFQIAVPINDDTTPVRFGTMYMRYIDRSDGDKGKGTTTGYYLATRSGTDGRIQVLGGGFAGKDVKNAGEVFAYYAVSGSVYPQHVYRFGDRFFYKMQFQQSSELVEVPGALVPEPLRQVAVTIDEWQLAQIKTFPEILGTGAYGSVDATAKIIADASAEVIETVGDPNTRDAATLISGILGFRGGPIVGTVSLLAAIGQVAENRFKDFYTEFAKLNYQNPSQVYGALRGAIDLLIRERSTNFAQLDQAISKNERLGRPSNGEYSEKIPDQRSGSIRNPKNDILF